MDDIKNERELLKVLEGLFKEKRFSDTLEIAQRAIRDYPSSFHIRFLYSRTLKALNRFEEAIDSLNDLMLIYPNNINLLMELGGISLQLKKYGDAVDQYNKILFLDPFNNQAKEALEKAKVLQKGSTDFISYQSRKLSNADTLHEFDARTLRPISTSTPKKETPKDVKLSPPPEPPPITVTSIPDTPLSIDLFDEFPEPLLPEPPEPPSPPPSFALPGDEEDISFKKDISFKNTPLEENFEKEDAFANEPLSEIYYSDDEPHTPFQDLPGIDHIEDAPGELHRTQKPLIGVDFGQPEEPAEENFTDFPGFDEEPAEILGLPLAKPTQASLFIPGEYQGDDSSSTVDSRLNKPSDLDAKQELDFPEPLVNLDFGDNESLVQETPTDEYNFLETPGNLQETEDIFAPDSESAELLGTPIAEEKKTDEKYNAVNSTPSIPSAIKEPWTNQPDNLLGDLARNLPDDSEDLPDDIDDLQDNLQDEPPIHYKATENGFVTESAAELYLKQGLLEDALAVYQQLFKSRNDEHYSLKIKKLQIQLINQKKMDVLNYFLKLIQKRGA